MIRVSNAREAWNVASMIFPYEYTKSNARSEAAGYPVYTADNGAYAWISDLGDRLELNYRAKTINIWIGDDAKDAMLKYLQGLLDRVIDEETNYGRTLIWDKKIDEMIACKEMVEAIINEPVNLGVNGKVTTGF